MVLNPVLHFFSQTPPHPWAPSLARRKLAARFHPSTQFTSGAGVVQVRRRVGGDVLRVGSGQKRRALVRAVGGHRGCKAGGGEPVPGGGLLVGSSVLSRRSGRQQPASGGVGVTSRHGLSVRQGGGAEVKRMRKHTNKRWVQLQHATDGCHWNTTNSLLERVFFNDTIIILFRFLPP